MTDEVVRFHTLLRCEDDVANQAGQILLRYRKRRRAMSKDKGSSETDQPWNLPGEYSQQPEQKGPPKRKAEDAYEGDKAQTS